MITRPLHLRWPLVLLVFAGGTLGTAAREAVGFLIPRVAEFPVAIFVINLLGAFLLGVLLEALVRRGPDVGVRRTLRLLLGTGFLGGFTTYSALATDTALLIGAGDAAVAVGYALATVVIGALASAMGIVFAATLHRRGARDSPR